VLNDSLESLHASVFVTLFFLWTNYFVVLFQDYLPIPNPKELLLSYKLANCVSALDSLFPTLPCGKELELNIS
jgi:hypothetical protein